MIDYAKYAQYRDEKGLSDAEVSRRAQIPQSTFSDWKKGKSTPKFDKMSKIAEALGMYYGEFVDPVSGKPINSEDPRFQDRFFNKPDVLSETDQQESQKAMELYKLYQNLTPENRIAFETLLKNLQSDS